MLKKLVLISALAIVLLAYLSTARRGRGRRPGGGHGPRAPQVCKLVDTDDNDAVIFEDTNIRCPPAHSCTLQECGITDYELTVCLPNSPPTGDKTPPCPCRIVIDDNEEHSSICGDDKECVEQWTLQGDSLETKISYCKPKPPPICNMQKDDDEDWYVNACPDPPEGEEDLECGVDKCGEQTFGDGSSYTVSRCHPSRDDDRPGNGHHRGRPGHGRRGGRRHRRSGGDSHHCACRVKKDGTDITGTGHDCGDQEFCPDTPHTVFTVNEGGSNKLYEFTFCRHSPPN